MKTPWIKGLTYHMTWSATCDFALHLVATTGRVVTELGRSLIDAERAGELLAVPKSWVLAEARADRIPHIRLGRYVRFDADELLEWCKSQRGTENGRRA